MFLLFFKLSSVLKRPNGVAERIVWLQSSREVGIPAEIQVKPAQQNESRGDPGV